MSRQRQRLIADVGVELGALLASARAVTNEAAAVFVEGREIRPATFHIARWLHSVGPARPTEIALALGMDKAAVSRLVADLLREGLVEKRRHRDARARWRAKAPRSRSAWLPLKTTSYARLRN
jgi:DNA-binding MarR family transcriptional regulator